MADFRSKLIIELSDAAKANLLKGLKEIETAEKKLGTGVSAGAARATADQKKAAAERLRELKQIGQLQAAEDKAQTSAAQKRLQEVKQLSQANIAEAKAREQLEQRAQATAREAAKERERSLKQQAAIQDALRKADETATRKQMQLDAQAAREKEQALRRTQQESAKLARQQEQEAARLLRQQQKDADAQRMGRLPTFVQFAAYPIGSLAQRLGANGAANAIFGAGDLLGTADSFTVIGDGIRALGTRLQDIQNPLGSVARFAGNLAGPLGSTAAGFASVLAIIGPLGLGLLALSAIMGEANRRAEAERKRIEEALQKREEITDLVAGGATSQDLRVRGQGLNASLQGQRDLRALLGAPNALRQQAISGTLPDDVRAEIEQRARDEGVFGTPGQSLVGDLVVEERVAALMQQIAAALELPSITNGQLEQAITQTDEAIASLEVDLGLLNNAAASAGVALNDQKEQLLAGLDAIEANAQREHQFNELRRGSSEAVEQAIRNEQLRLRIAQESIPTLQQLANVDAQYADELRATTDAVQQSTQDLEDLKRVLREVQIREFVTKVIDAFKEGLTGFGDLAAKQEDAYREIDERFAERRRDLDERFNESDLEARIKYNEDLEKLKRDFDAANTEDEIKAREDEAQLQEKFDDQREDQLKEHHRRLQEIEDDYQYDLQLAVGNRDAQAAHLAELKRDKDVKKENERYAALEQERDDDFKRQKQDLQSNLDSQRRARQRDYDRRLSELLTAFRQEEQQRQRKYTNDLNQLAREYEQERILQAQEFVRSFNALRDHLIAKAGIENSFFRWIEARARAMIGNVGGNASTSASTSSAPYQYTIPSTYQFRAKGGPMEAFRDTVVGEQGPEVLRVPMRGAHVYTLDQYQKLGGNNSGSIHVTVPITAIDWSARTERRVIRAVDQRIHETFVQKRGA